MRMPLAKLGRRHAEVARKGAREAFMALEPRIERDVEHRVLGREQRECGRLELQPARVLLRTLADNARERALKARRRRAGIRGEVRERVPLVAMGREPG